jgi:hypothetical protein
MPKGRKVTKTQLKNTALRGVVSKDMSLEKLPDKVLVHPEDIRKWKAEIIPDGSGVPAQVRYEKMSPIQLEREAEKTSAVAKMYLLDRIIDLAPQEKDLAKVSAALRDLSNISSKAKDEGTERSNAWGEFVDRAIKEVVKKRGVINVIQNQQINHGEGAN